MDWVIAVKSHLRPQLFAEQSYKMLKHNNLLDITTVFVVSEEEAQRYRDAINDERVKIVPVGVVGVQQCMKFITEYYPAGKPFFLMDDDAKSFWYFHQQEDGKVKLIKNADNLRAIIQEGFDTVQLYNLGSFYFRHATNRIWLHGTPWKDFDTTGKLFGTSFGVLNSDLVNTPPGTGSLDDYFRGINFTKEYGGTLCFNWCGFDTKCGITPGGVQDNGERGTKENRLQKTKADAERWLVENPQYTQFFAGIIHKPKFNMYQYKWKNRRQIRKMLQEQGYETRLLTWTKWFSVVSDQFIPIPPVDV